MTTNINGQAVILYTFTKGSGGEEKYKNKIDNLKRLLPDDIVDLEDQSSILIQSGCDLKSLSSTLQNQYEGTLEEKEYVILITLSGTSLSCMTIQHLSLENLINKKCNDFIEDNDLENTHEYVQTILHLIRENMSQTLNNIIKKGRV